MILTSLLLSFLVPSTPYTWQNVAIVGGGFVTGVLPHPAAKDVIYARTDIGGAYRWDSQGQRWIPIEDWLTRDEWTHYGIESVGLDPSDPKRLYVATGTYTNSWSKEGAILRSVDQGRSFKKIPLPFKNGGNEDGRSMGERLAVDPNEGRVLLFGTRNNGLVRSTDYGDTWKPVPGFPIKGRTNGIGISWVLFDASTGQKGNATRTIYAGVTSGPSPLLRSQDAGVTWKPIPGQPTKFMPHHSALAADGWLYITYSNGPGPNGVSDGAVWKYNVTTSKWVDITPKKPGGEDKFGYAGLAMNSNNPNVVMVSTLDRWGKDTIFRSIDAGTTWKSIADKAIRDSSLSPFLNWGRPQAEFGHWIGDVKIDPFNANRAWYVTGATIWRTEDLTNADHDMPTHWVVGAKGLEETAVIDMVSPPVGPYVVSGLGDIGGFDHTSLNRAPAQGMWSNPILSNVDSLDFASEKPKVFVRVGRGYDTKQNGGVSYDGAHTWKPLETDPPGTQNGGGTVAISADAQVILWAIGGSVFRTTDEGKTWATCAGVSAGRVISDRVDPATFYLQDPKGQSIYASHDAGLTFAQVDRALLQETGRLVAVFGKKGDLWIPSPHGLMRSVSGGKSFDDVIGPDSVEQISFGKAAPGKDYPAIYIIGKVGGVQGVFRSTDEAKTWIRINDPNTGFGTMMYICGDPKEFGRVYVGTNGRGLITGIPRRTDLR